MRLYQVNKLAKAGGKIIKRIPILASSDRRALEAAEDKVDCPVCDVLRDGEKIGEIL